MEGNRDLVDRGDVGDRHGERDRDGVAVDEDGGVAGAPDAHSGGVVHAGDEAHEGEHGGGHDGEQRGACAAWERKGSGQFGHGNEPPKVQEALVGSAARRSFLAAKIRSFASPALAGFAFVAHRCNLVLYELSAASGRSTLELRMNWRRDGVRKGSEAWEAGMRTDPGRTAIDVRRCARAGCSWRNARRISSWRRGRRGGSWCGRPCRCGWRPSWRRDRARSRRP
jgi:hypothetical protein